MSSGELALIVAAIAIVLGLARLWRSAEGRAEVLTGEIEKLQSEREDLAARLSRESQARKKDSEQLASQRKRADKARKRKSKTNQDLPLGTAARIGDLEAQIERAERERDRSRAEREQLAQQVAQLEARVEISARAAEEATAARRDAARKTTPPAAGEGAPAAADASLGEALRGELAETREREAKLADALQVAKQTEARMRKRMGNQEQLYASIRAELDVKKDRLRTQEEQIQRLQALKVAVSD